VKVTGGAIAPFPGGSGSAPGPFSLAAADFNYDYRADLVLAGAGGVRLLRQDEAGGFADVTAATTLPAALVDAPASGVWVADIDTEGDLDVVLAPTQGPPVVLRNNGDGTFAELRPFAAVPSLRDFAWADLDGDGVPDAILLDAQGAVHVLLNYRGGLFREEALPAGLPPMAALATADTNGDALFDVLGAAVGGSVLRIGLGDDGRSGDTKTIARLGDPPAGLAPGAARLASAPRSRRPRGRRW